MRKIISLFVLTAAVLLSAMVTGCADKPEEAIAKQAMECLKNGDAEGYVETTVDAIPSRGRNIIKTLQKNRNGIKSYKLKGVKLFDEPYYLATFEITDGNGSTFDGDIILKKDQEGNFRVNDVDNWWRTNSR